jgi:hypothetical protein
MNKKTELGMLRELRDWMDKYDVYFNTIYYDYPRIVITNCKDQSGIIDSNGCKINKFDIDEYLLENKEEDNEV